MGSAEPFSIYEDEGELHVEDAEVSTLSLETCDVPVESMEDEAPVPASFSAIANRRRTSTFTSTSISSLPSDIRLDDEPDLNHRYTPLKSRAAFRNPSSVRAMQMSSPPPFSGVQSSPVTHRAIRVMQEPRRSESVQSHRSSRSQQLQSPRPSTPRTPVQAPKQQYPLVLLHVTLLPFSIPYPAHLIKATLPPWLVDNFRLVEAKLADSVLMGRGVLIPHPREEYDLLEERLLESLELTTPRILKCGHFYRDYEGQEGGSILDYEEGVSGLRSGTPNYSMMHDEKEEEEEEDLDMLCHECEQPLGHPEIGAGAGKRRWEVRIYAANGLMRAGAWAAAWSEMERVDVEVTPWIPEHLKRELEQKWELELRENDIKTGVEAKHPPSQTNYQSIDHGLPSPPLSTTSPVPPVDLKIEHDKSHAHEEFNYHAAADAATFERPVSRGPPPSRAASRISLRSQRRTDDIPLGTLLKNYLFLLSQDRRNIALGLLSVLVVLLCLKPSLPAHTVPELSYVYDIQLPDNHVERPVQSIQQPIATEAVIEAPPIARENPISTSIVVVTETVFHSATPSPSSDPETHAPALSSEPERKAPSSNSEPEKKAPSPSSEPERQASQESKKSEETIKPIQSENQVKNTNIPKMNEGGTVPKKARVSMDDHM